MLNRKVEQKDKKKGNRASAPGLDSLLLSRRQQTTDTDNTVHRDTHTHHNTNTYAGTNATLLRLRLSK